MIARIEIRRRSRGTGKCVGCNESGCDYEFRVIGSSSKKRWLPIHGTCIQVADEQAREPAQENFLGGLLGAFAGVMLGRAMSGPGPSSFASSSRPSLRTGLPAGTGRQEADRKAVIDAEFEEEREK